jgi:hypothetical protein
LISVSSGAVQHERGEWCAADPGSTFLSHIDGSRLCGAAQRALRRVRDTRGGIPPYLA